MGDGEVGNGCKAWPPAGGGCSGGRGRLHARSRRRPAAAATVILTWGSVSVWRVTSTAQSTAPPTWAASAAAGTAGGGGGERRAAAGVCRRPCAAASAAAGAAARHPCPPWGCWAAGGAWGSAPHEGARMLAINILYPQRACVPGAAALRMSSAARLRWPARAPGHRRLGKQDHPLSLTSTTGAAHAQLQALLHAARVQGASRGSRPRCSAGLGLGARVGVSTNTRRGAGQRRGSRQRSRKCGESPRAAVLCSARCHAELRPHVTAASLRPSQQARPGPWSMLVLQG